MRSPRKPPTGRVRALRDSVRLAAPRPPRPRRGRLGGYVHDLAEGHRRFLEEEGVLLEVHVPPPEEPVYAFYDPQAVDQLFATLIHDAVLRSSSSGDRSIEVWVSRERDHARVRVLDRGVSSVEGLASARDRARALGGELAAEPRAGGGLEVTVTLPSPG